MNMNEPKLRFKADDGSQFPDWEEKELGQILTEDLYPVENPDGAYTKLAIRSHGKGTFDRHVEAGESLDVDKMFEVKANRLILNITFAWELAIAITTKEDEGKLVSHRFPQYMISGNVDFYKYRLINERMRYDLGVASPGGAGRNRVLNKSAFLKIRKYIPSLPEQQKIAEFLSTIDTVIEKQKETVSAWEERKKGVMQKLFNQEVRFKADDGSDFPDTELVSIGEHITFSGGSQPDKKYFIYEERERYIRLVQTQDYRTDKYKTYIPIEKARKTCTETDVMIGRYGPPVFQIKRGIAGAYNVALIKATEKDSSILDKEFMFYLLNRNDLFLTLDAVSRRSAGQAGVDMELLKKFKFYLPSIPEQQKIADCLSSLDEVIEKQKATLAAWEELKKGLLQQMFV